MSKKREKWEILTMENSMILDPKKCTDQNDINFCISMVHQFVLNFGLADYAIKKIKAILSRENEIIVEMYQKSMSSDPNSEIAVWELNELQKRNLR